MNADAVFMPILSFVVIVAALMGLAYYIFQAIGLYGISQKRGYQNAWLAFIPVANSYLMGGIADNIAMCYGKRSNWRIWMLVLSILSTISSLFIAIFSTRWLFDMIPVMMYGSAYSSSMFWDGYLRLMTVAGLGSLVSIGTTVVAYICLYKIYQDYSRNATAFLVLSILIPMFTGVSLAPFFLFSLRNKPSASLYYRSQPQAQPDYPQSGNPAGGYYPPNNNYPPQPPVYR